MVQYDWRLCLAVSVVLGPIWVATRLFQIFGMRAYRRVREQSSRITASIAESIAGVRVVQAFAREETNLANFQKVQDVYFDRFIASARIFHTYMPFVGLLSGVGTAIILGYGGSLALRNEITVGELAAFILYLGMFFGPIQTMGDLYNSLLSTAASAERFFGIAGHGTAGEGPRRLEPMAAIRGHVVFENIWFRYDTTPENQWVLRDVSFEAKPGETVALVGATGSGKNEHHQPYHAILRAAARADHD
jgi:ABC-type multidrug transport system fused ATPase/permease subunit